MRLAGGLLFVASVVMDSGTNSKILPTFFRPSCASEVLSCVQKATSLRAGVASLVPKSEKAGGSKRDLCNRERWVDCVQRSRVSPCLGSLRMMRAS